MQAVSLNGYALKFAAEELKGDRKIAMAAVSNNGFALQYATEELKGDCEIVRAAVSENGRALQHATEELKGDHDIVMQAVSKNGLALDDAADWLKGDREIVMAALSEDGTAIRCATKELKDDEEILQHALERSGNCRHLVGLKVVLMSGRYCSEVFRRGDRMSVALRRCALSLDLDPNYVERNGTLMRDPTEVKDLFELEPGNGLVAGDSAICGRLAALILRLRPAGLRFEEFRSPVKRGGLGLRFSNRSGLRPAAI